MSAKIESFNKVREYPVDGPYQILTIRNHWAHRDRVILSIEDKEYTFVAEHLLMAIKNATNCS